MDAWLPENHAPQILIAVINDAMASMGLVGMEIIAFAVKKQYANKLKQTLESKFNPFQNFLILKIIKFDLIYNSINVMNYIINKQIR